MGGAGLLRGSGGCVELRGDAGAEELDSRSSSSLSGRSDSAAKLLFISISALVPLLGAEVSAVFFLR